MALKHLGIAAAALSLAGCATAPELVYETYDAVLVAYGHYGHELSDAQAAAQQSCQKNGRSARLVTGTENEFDSVATFMCDAKLPQ